MTVDDVSLDPGRCPGNSISCDFDGGLCGWTNKALKDNIWLVGRGYTGDSNVVAGPLLDHTTQDGLYAYVDFTSFDVQGKSWAAGVLLLHSISVEREDYDTIQSMVTLFFILFFLLLLLLFIFRYHYHDYCIIIIIIIMIVITLIIKIAIIIIIYFVIID